jgi:hypothetical protein
MAHKATFLKIIMLTFYQQHQESQFCTHEGGDFGPARRLQHFNVHVIVLGVKLMTQSERTLQ